MSDEIERFPVIGLDGAESDPVTCVRHFDHTTSREADKARIAELEASEHGLLGRLETCRQDEAKLRAKNDRLRQALIWCSGSDDFQDGGKARIGWLRLCAPLIHGEKA